MIRHCSVSATIFSELSLVFVQSQHAFIGLYVVALSCEVSPFLSCCLSEIRLGVEQLLKCGVEESGVDVEFGIGEEEVVVVWCDA